MEGKSWKEAHKLKPWNKTSRGRKPKGEPLTKDLLKDEMDKWLKTNVVKVIPARYDKESNKRILSIIE